MDSINYKFSLALSIVLSIAYLSGVSILIGSEKILFFQTAFFVVLTLLWGGLLYFRISKVNELALIFFLGILEYLNPTLVLKPLGFLHGESKSMLEGTCSYSIEAKISKSGIKQIEGFGDITVFHSLFIGNTGCQEGDRVGIHVLESFYGYRISHIEVIEE